MGIMLPDSHLTIVAVAVGQAVVFWCWLKLAHFQVD
jgi:hypothetical protein